MAATSPGLTTRPGAETEEERRRMGQFTGIGGGAAAHGAPRELAAETFSGLPPTGEVAEAMRPPQLADAPPAAAPATASPATLAMGVAPCNTRLVRFVRIPASRFR